MSALVPGTWWQTTVVVEFLRSRRRARPDPWGIGRTTYTTLRSPYTGIAGRCAAVASSPSTRSARFTSLAPQRGSGRSFGWKRFWCICKIMSWLRNLYKINSTKSPAYLSDIIHEYHPTRTLRSADKLLLAVPRMSLTLSVKAFCVSAPFFSLELTVIELQICWTSQYFQGRTVWYCLQWTEHSA